METVVRPALPADAPGLEPLLAQIGFPAPADVIADRLHALRALNEMVLVAERNGRPMGVLTVHHTPVLHRAVPVARLTLLVVEEGARGQGIGRALVEAAECELAASGCEQVEVVSNRRYTGAHAFYQRLGYELTSYKFRKEIENGDPG